MTAVSAPIGNGAWSTIIDILHVDSLRGSWNTLSVNWQQRRAVLKPAAHFRRTAPTRHDAPPLPAGRPHEAHAEVDA